jgi:hypothetical protein
MAQTGLPPYVPTKFLHETTFPKAFGRDLQMQIRLIEERWRRFYLLLDYYPLLQMTGIASTPDARTAGIPAPIAPVDPAGGGFDPLWGESVDRDMADAGQWDQPHLSGGALDATTEAEGFAAPVQLHFQVQGVATPGDKKRLQEAYGFDDVRDVVLVTPATFFDAIGLRAKEGDKFVFDGEEYVVIEDRGAGRWKNTNIRLYRALNAEHKRLGS